jgi:hypothetical protein
MLSFGKDDRRFFLVIGIMYLIKNVSYSPGLHVPLLTILVDRLPKCSTSQGPASWPTAKHPQGAPHDHQPVQLGPIHLFFCTLAKVERIY